MQINVHKKDVSNKKIISSHVQMKSRQSIIVAKINNELIKAIFHTTARKKQNVGI